MGDGRTRGNLVIGREVGEGIYIGREVRLTMTAAAANGVTVRVTGAAVVTDEDYGWPVHLRAVEEAERSKVPAGTDGREFVLLVGAGILVGRGVEVTLVELADQRAQFAIEAPRWMAVSRDDFTFDEHMRYQVARERKNGAR